MFNRNDIDIVSLGQGYYVFISPNRINFMSGIDKDKIEDAVNEELKEIRNIQQEERQKDEVLLSPSIAFMPKAATPCLEETRRQTETTTMSWKGNCGCTCLCPVPPKK